VGGSMRVSPVLATGVGEGDMQPHVGERWCGAGGKLYLPRSIASGPQNAGTLLGGRLAVFGCYEVQESGAAPSAVVTGRGTCGGEGECLLRRR